MAHPALALFFLLAGTPEQRAVTFLAREVPQWRRDNGCFSCHNNGDGARALYAASRSGLAVPAAALTETNQWLLDPAAWDRNPGTPGFNNAALGRIQFAAALTESAPAAREILVGAARLLLRDQDADGSWRIDTGGAPGAPATYGTPLATYMARRTLEAAASPEFAPSIARANRWLASAAPQNLLDIAATLLALPRSPNIRGSYVDRLLSAQSADGGWGSQPRTPSEPFDTAVALLALHAVGDPSRTAKAVTRGRAFLVAAQQPDGSWLETTRPPGQLSYAEHISTSAWALYALLKVK